MFEQRAVKSMLRGAVILAAMIVVATGSIALEQTPGSSRAAATRIGAGQYVLLAWNDLGMHCYNADFQDLAVLPPYNTLWAQVVRLGEPPEIVTAGVTVTYEFPDNTFSVGKSNFWEYDQQLFGVDLPPNVGLAGKGLSGQMDPHGDHFVAEGIPLTEYRDSDPVTPYPYQLATVVARTADSGAELARATVVAPVSSEMHCDYCHYDGGVEEIATGRVATNILTLHDQEHADEYPADQATPLMDRRPVLCAACHASNALGTGGLPGLPNLSRAMHEKHSDKVTPDLEGCYSCHPGPQTQCLRDVMSGPPHNLDCIDCHGGMEQVAANPDPWLHEPRCDNDACHGAGYQQDQPLYRMSQEHGGVYCAACHDSPHAIAPSREPNDQIKFVALQGHAGALSTCTVCHAVAPTGDGPHGSTAPALRGLSFGPDGWRVADPGAQVVYRHALRNTGNVSDTYGVSWSSSQGWANVGLAVDGRSVLPPLGLASGETAQVAVTVTVPNTAAVIGLSDTTAITATSLVSPTLFRSVADTTLVPHARVYLPLLLRE